MDTNLSKKQHTFIEYFHTIINYRVEMFINELSIEHHTYLFSGILRNFFLNIYVPPRDLDIVISRKKNSSNLLKILNKFGSYKINSFGGFKLEIKGLSIDIWYIEDTWAIKNKIISVNNKNIESAVLHSTFFNFSSILYDFEKKIFIYNSIFSDFLKTKTIDIVLKKNPSEILCVVNIIYYAENYKLNLSNKTKKFFIDKFPIYKNIEYENIQKKHFGRVLYNHKDLFRFSLNISVGLND